MPLTAILKLALNRYIDLQFLFQPITLTNKSACLIYAEPVTGLEPGRKELADILGHRHGTQLSLEAA